MGVAPAWATGQRRDQSPATRSAIAVVERDRTFSGAHGPLVKLNPLAAWSGDEVRTYMRLQGLPEHPLYADGYRSIGCAPCTRAVAPGEHARAGRWWWENGIEKECGVHATPRLVAI